VPVAQRVPPSQLLPQPPQFRLSSFTSVHWVEQMTPPLHTQLPFEQALPALQMTPTHDRSVHRPAKQTDSGSQSSCGQSSATQTPFAHEVPAAQALPHAPQLASSSSRFLQAPAHVVWPGPHTQAPPLQTWP
jgi:hypothetical protein